MSNQQFEVRMLERAKTRPKGRNAEWDRNVLRDVGVSELILQGLTDNQARELVNGYLYLLAQNLRK